MDNGNLIWAAVITVFTAFLTTVATGLRLIAGIRTNLIQDVDRNISGDIAKHQLECSKETQSKFDELKSEMKSEFKELRRELKNGKH